MYIINDTHLGVTRQAGTTPVSQAALTEYVHERFLGLLPNSDLATLVINGDLFDGFTVDPKEVLWAYQVLADWLDAGDGAQTLHLVAGNHDWSPKADRLSSFHMLAELLCHRYPDWRVKVHDHTQGYARIAGEVWAIPHMPNQDQFDIELKKALAGADGKYLLLHANYNNNFAAESDHSLNVSEDQAKELIAAGWHLIFAHEHQQREPMTGVTVIGNQFPTSVADCLRNGTKRMLEIATGELFSHTTWSADEFLDLDWREVSDENLDKYRFIRVSGNATAAEAEAAVNTVAAVRKRATAFVVSNAIRVEGLAEMDQLMSLSLEDVQSYDVLGALCDELTPEEAKVVKELLA